MGSGGNGQEEELLKLFLSQQVGMKLVFMFMFMFMTYVYVYDFMCKHEVKLLSLLDSTVKIVLLN